jgi:hypothetical protein
MINDEGFVPEDLPDMLKGELITCYRFAKAKFDRMMNEEQPAEIAMLCLPIGLFLNDKVNPAMLVSYLQQYEEAVALEEQTVDRIVAENKKKIYETWEIQQRTNQYNLEELCLTEDEVRSLLSPEEGGSDAQV